MLFVLVSCNSDDGNDIEKDPVYDSEYTPLKSLNELSGVYFYGGAKIGDRRFGSISSSNCLSGNLMIFGSNNEPDSERSFVFKSHKQDKFVDNLCADDYTRIIFNMEMSSEGKILGKISGPRYGEDGSISSMKKLDDDREELEIGFQAGYLRIEDKLSLNDNKSKTYLYFKKM